MLLLTLLLYRNFVQKSTLNIKKYFCILKVAILILSVWRYFILSYMEQVGEKIRELREETSTPQQKIADLLGVTRQSLSLYEKGERTINVEALGKLAEFFNVSADYLLGLSDVRSTEQDMRAACEVTGLSEETITKLKADTPTAWAVDVLVCSYVSTQDDNFVKSEVSPLKLISQYIFSAFVSEDIATELVQLELNKKADISKEEATKIAKNMLDYFTEKELLDRIKLSLKDVKAAIAHSKTINKDLEAKTDGEHHTTQE